VNQWVWVQLHGIREEGSKRNHAALLKESLLQIILLQVEEYEPSPIAPTTHWFSLPAAVQDSPISLLFEALSEELERFRVCNRCVCPACTSADSVALHVILVQDDSEASARFRCQRISVQLHSGQDFLVIDQNTPEMEWTTFEPLQLDEEFLRASRHLRSIPRGRYRRIGSRLGFWLWLNFTKPTHIPVEK